MVHAFVLLKVEPARIAGLASALTEIHGVAEVYSVAGDVDLVVIVRVRHHDDLAEVVTTHMSALPGIRETRTMVAYQAFSQHDLDAMWDIGTESSTG
jgi:DNA-binding Lrp family transcriptional regulator